jgi:dienelactone hydrolase
MLPDGEPPLYRRDFLKLTAVTALGCGYGQLALAAGIDERIQRLASEAPLKMRFRGTTAADCRRWQTAFAEKLRSLLGPHQPPKAWDTVVERTVDLPDHQRQELILTAKGHPPLPVYLLLPRKLPKKPLPGILAVHGHGKYGADPVAGRDSTPGAAHAIKNSNYDYGRQLVRRGYIVAVPCMTPFGRRLGDPKQYQRQDPCAVTFIRLQLLGKLLIAENLRDLLWSVELLSRHKAVNPKRLGCVGLSYGGRMTMLAAALEPRIRVAAISGAMNCMQERIAQRYSCGAQVIPGLLEYGDIPEIASLIAPRPSLWEVGKKDGLMVPRWVDIARQRIAVAYKALQADEHFQIDRFDGGHVWHGTIAYRLLDKVLKSA